MKGKFSLMHLMDIFRYIGVLLVTNSTKVADSDLSLNETAKKIYYDAQLGNTKCDNGLLIIYVKDKKQVTYSKRSFLN